jgi:hypothetical protein
VEENRSKNSGSTSSRSNRIPATTPSGQIASTAALREEFTQLLDLKLKSKVDQMVRDILDIRQQHLATVASAQGRFASLDIQFRNKSNGIIAPRGC